MKQTLPFVLAVTVCTCFASAAANRYILPKDMPQAPVSIDLEGNDFAGMPVLTQVDDGKKTPVACQLENGHTARLWFVGKGGMEYELAFEDEAAQTTEFASEMNADTIDLKYKGEPILSYRHSIMDVPAGVDPLFKRSGFIHPLCSPEGKVLTRVQAPDHYHHYGIWNPWTKATIDGQTVDFWNLKEGQGTVRFAGVLSYYAGPVYAGFKVRQEHVMLKPEEKVAMNEVWDVRAFAVTIENRPAWIIDFTSILHNALKTPILLNDYRYGGGIGFRATEDWNKDNSSVLTSEGKQRAEADGTRARWCDVRGTVGEGPLPSGILFMSHTTNQDHPEPMRVWPLDANKRGDVYFEFCPIRINSWTLEPQKEYLQRYRMVVYDGTIEPTTAENLWKTFTQPPIAVKQSAK